MADPLLQIIALTIVTMRFAGLLMFKDLMANPPAILGPPGIKIRDFIIKIGIQQNEKLDRSNRTKPF